MKDTKILVIANCLLVIGLLWTLGVAQASAVNYQTKYKGTMYNVQSTASYGAAAPSATFQSTSAYASPEWAEESTLNQTEMLGVLRPSLLQPESQLLIVRAQAHSVH